MDAEYVAAIPRPNANPPILPLFARRADSGHRKGSANEPAPEVAVAIGYGTSDADPTSFDHRRALLWLTAFDAIEIATSSWEGRRRPVYAQEQNYHSSAASVCGVIPHLDRPHNDAPTSASEMVVLAASILFSITQLDKLISNRSELYNLLSGGYFFKYLSELLINSRYVCDARRASRHWHAHSPSAARFYRALDLSIEEHDNLLLTAIEASLIYNREISGDLPRYYLRSAYLPAINIENVRPLLLEWRNLEREREFIDQHEGSRISCIGGTLSSALETKAQANDLRPMVSRFINGGSDTDGSLDLSRVSKRMVLPSRDIYSGNLSSLSVAPTFH